MKKYVNNAKSFETYFNDIPMLPFLNDRFNMTTSAVEKMTFIPKPWIWSFCESFQENNMLFDVIVFLYFMILVWYDVNSFIFISKNILPHDRLLVDCSFTV